MKIEEFGIENEKIIVMLHGANFVHTFGRQYTLAKQYHIIVPHIMGFGDEANRIFETDSCVKELAEYIESLGEKVALVGFSLGSQLAFKLISEYEHLFHSAILVSPWLIKEEPLVSYAMEANLKKLRLFKKRWLCNIIGLMNGLLPSDLRKEFVEQMQNVKEETIENVVDNGITTDSVPAFTNVSVPIVAIVGEKEQKEMIDGVIKLSEINTNCKYEIWNKAGHNIPPMFAKRFNKLICSVIK